MTTTSDPVVKSHQLDEQFPFAALPHAAFEAAEPPFQPAPVMAITDTTFRDGQQSRQPFTTQQVVDLHQLLRRLDNGSGVISQSEFFLYSAQERATVERVLSLSPGLPEVTGWIRARSSDLQAVSDLGIRETGILTSVSDIHLTHKLKMNRQQALAAYLEVIDQAIERGIRPRCHFEDVTRADIEGFVLPFAGALMDRARSSGVPIKIRLCDTMGVALPWAAAALPRGVPRLVRALIERAGVPSEQLEWHGHNDFFKGHANAMTAWLYGCGAVNTTMLSLGERCGNSPLEGAVVDYLGLRTKQAGSNGRDPDVRVLTEIAAYLAEECEVEIARTYPLLGRDAFSTRAGVHIDGLLKHPETYLSFDSDRVLGRPPEVVVSMASGTAGVAWWVNRRRQALGLPPVDKGSQGVAAVYTALRARYEAGIGVDPDDRELLSLVRDHAPELLPERS